MLPTNQITLKIPYNTREFEKVVAWLNEHAGIWNTDWRMHSAHLDGDVTRGKRLIYVLYIHEHVIPLLKLTWSEYLD